MSEVPEEIEETRYTNGATRRFLLRASPALVEDLDELARIAWKFKVDISALPRNVHEEEEEEIRLRVLSALREQVEMAYEERRTVGRRTLAFHIAKCYARR